MNEAQRLILEALRKSLPPFDGFEHACAVAASEVDKALGGLTQETRVIEGVFEMGVPEPATRWVSRYVEASRWAIG